MTEPNTHQSEILESDWTVPPERHPLGRRSLSTDYDQLQDLWNTGSMRGLDAGENSATAYETEGGLMSNERDETASGILPDDSSTELPSGSSERPHSQASDDDAESIKFDAKTRWAFLDEERREDSDANLEHASQGFEGLALHVVQRPEVPPSIMEQIRITGSQHQESLTEEQYQNFLKHPRERQRQSLRVVLDNLAGLGP